MPERPPTLPMLDTLPARAVLEGLARLHQAVFASDERGRMVWISDALGTLRGTEPDDAAPDDRGWRKARPAREYFARPEQLEEIRSRFAREGKVHGAPAELLGRDGQLIPVEIDAVHVGVEGGGEPVLVGIVRPRPKPAERDEELRETAAFLSGILASSPAPVLAVDQRGFITYANGAVRELLGHEPHELLEKPVAMLAASPGEFANAILAGETIRNHEVELQHADGSSRFATLSASELRLGERPQSGSVLLIHDQTDRRQQHEELVRKNGELEHYVQNVTHDLRSPLVSLLGFSRLLSQEYGDGMDETARHFLDRIEKAGRAMEALINDLLELSRIGRTRDHKAYVNVSDVLSQLHAELKPRLESQRVRLSLPDEAAVVMCDRTRLYQVFSNLIGNALDYMGPAENAEIRIDVHEEPGEHRLVVSDNGRGVDPANRDRIFELFQSCGPRADGRRGTGIGLAIVKKIAQSQGGRVWVESCPGEGAAFHVTLPRD